MHRQSVELLAVDGLGAKVGARALLVLRLLILRVLQTLADARAGTEVRARLCLLTELGGLPHALAGLRDEGEPLH